MSQSEKRAMRIRRLEQENENLATMLEDSEKRCRRFGSILLAIVRVAGQGRLEIPTDELEGNPKGMALGIDPDPGRRQTVLRAIPPDVVEPDDGGRLIMTPGEAVRGMRSKH